ncbi:3-oxoacyl-[acyl-carrier-protein] synthase II [Crossiella equi]|uniref:3-oxoacyl-[acyl-carrier-protein] synthase II n=1 Tax=Crossiella equi TaxID=130796 RepID=A0ABS5AA97_9PSEU|nr:beta-ketoacyl-[acyl-carrier-protein] synthase family protein [Crossiella equi]MBP2473506.1 3-oxoacyl-[acyl-carrier-protein] synthase II [Crossiella equi]
MAEDDRRVVVTGYGVLSPLGETWAATWRGLVEGRGGIRALTTVDTTGLPVRFGGELAGFQAGAHLPEPLVARTGRATHLALVAAQDALADAGLTLTDAPDRAAVLLGTVGAPTTAVLRSHEAFTRRGFKGVHPYAFAGAGVVTGAAEVALHVGAQGPCASLVTACATGATCVGEGMRLIQAGRADVVLAGGAEDSLTRLDIATAARAGALSRRNDDPAGASRPFDRARDGFVMSAGAAVLVLESAAHARDRGAEVRAELAGYGASTDAFHLAAPQPDGRIAERAVRAALAEARLDPADLGHVNAHGTGTPRNDTTEIRLLRRVFGHRLPRIPVSATKSATGHLLAAAGALEAVLAVQAIRDGVLPPTLNLTDPEHPDLDLVPHTARTRRVDSVLSNSFGFGGHNAALLLRRWRP